MDLFSLFKRDNLLSVYFSHPDAKLNEPRDGDAGYDLFTTEKVTLPAASWRVQTEIGSNGDFFTDSGKGVLATSLPSTSVRHVAHIAQIKINTGVRLAIPSGFVGLIFDKSSIGAKGVKVYGGVIDSTYRGDVIVILGNHTDEDITFDAGQKIAQLIIMPYLALSISYVSNPDKLGATERGEGGFGSTGSK